MTSSSSLVLGFDLDCHAFRVRWIALRLISLPILSPLAYLHVSSYILMPSLGHSVFPACAVSQSHLSNTMVARVCSSSGFLIYLSLAS